jgi:dTMP kinase
VAQGLFIAIEGGDGAGKSTQMGLLCDALEARDLTIIRTREPGGTALGERLRKELLHGEHIGPVAEALLYAADRAHHIEEVIKPALEAGVIVVTDRYVDSSVAYQSQGRGLALSDVLVVNGFATGGVLPDLTVLLDIPSGAGRGRLIGEGDRIEQESGDFHERVRERFLLQAASAPNRYAVINALDSVEQIHAKVLSAVNRLIELWQRQ